MNIVNICPDIPDDWRGGITDVAKVLGLSKSTIIRKSNLGKRYGGIDWHLSKSGRKQFSGREVKRFWRDY